MEGQDGDKGGMFCNGEGWEGTSLEEVCTAGLRSTCSRGPLRCLHRAVMMEAHNNPGNVAVAGTEKRHQFGRHSEGFNEGFNDAVWKLKDSKDARPEASKYLRDAAQVVESH